MAAKEMVMANLTAKQAIKMMTDEAVRRASPDDLAAMKVAVLSHVDAVHLKMRERRGDPLFKSDAAEWYLQICRDVAREAVAMTAPTDDRQGEVWLAVMAEQERAYTAGQNVGRREALAEAVVWLRARAAAASAEIDDECDGVDAERFSLLANDLREAANDMEKWAKGGAK